MKKALFIVIIICNSIMVTAQIKAVTETGDTINVYENGKWDKLLKQEKVEEILSTVKATESKVDEFDNKKTITTEYWEEFGVTSTNNKVIGYLQEINNIIYFRIIYLGDLGCLSQHSSTMKVKLTNGEVIEFSQVSQTDCSSSRPAARFIPITSDEMELPNYQNILDENVRMLKDYDWVTIRLTGTKYYTNITPNKTRKVANPEQFFRQHIIAAKNM